MIDSLKALQPHRYWKICVCVYIYIYIYIYFFFFFFSYIYLTFVFVCLSFRISGSKPEVLFTLSEGLSRPDATAGTSELTQMGVPREHKFVLNGIGNQNLVVLSQTPTAGESLKPFIHLKINLISSVKIFF